MRGRLLSPRSAVTGRASGNGRSQRGFFVACPFGLPHQGLDLRPAAGKGGNAFGIEMAPALLPTGYVRGRLKRPSLLVGAVAALGFEDVGNGDDAGFNGIARPLRPLG